MVAVVTEKLPIFLACGWNTIRRRTRSFVPSWSKPIVGGSQNAAKDPAASTNGTGSVCVMYFTNVQIITTKGQPTVPYVVLAHELIHSYHCLYGIKFDGKDEELKTTGIGVFRDEKLSENVFRAQFGVQLRVAYF